MASCGVSWSGKLKSSLPTEAHAPRAVPKAGGSPAEGLALDRPRGLSTPRQRLRRRQAMGTDRDSAECHPSWLLSSPRSPGHALKLDRVRRPLRLGRGPQLLRLPEARFCVTVSLHALPPGSSMHSAQKWALRPCACSGLRSPPSAQLSYGASYGAAFIALSSEPHGRMSFVFLWTVALEHGLGSPRGSFCVCSLEGQAESPSAGSR